MNKICELCIIWEENGILTKKILLKDTLNNIDKFIIDKKYNSSNDIRNDKSFKSIIDTFLENKKILNKNYKGNVVILNGDRKIRVMYKPRIDLIKNFMKLLIPKMKKCFDKKTINQKDARIYCKSFIKKYPTLFSEIDRIGLYTGLKYNKKTLFEQTLSSWKKKYTSEKDNQYMINYMREIYRVMGNDIKSIINTLLKEEYELESTKEEKVNVSICNTDDIDEFELDKDEGLVINHLNEKGEIIKKERYSDYLNRTEELVETPAIDKIEDIVKRFK